MGAVAAGASIVGAGVSAYGAIKSAQDEADLERQKADLARLQAQEVLDREGINDQNTRDATLRAKMDFGSAYAATGAQGGIGSKLEIQRQTDAQIALNDREANFQALMLEKGASMQDAAANNVENAGYWSAAGSILGGVGRAGLSMSNQPAGKSQTLAFTG